jgi:hypothetical protein
MNLPPKVVTIELTMAEAERFRDGMADVICWSRGFNAGLGPDRRDEGPMSINDLSDLNLKIKSAIEKAF